MNLLGFLINCDQVPLLLKRLHIPKSMLYTKPDRLVKVPGGSLNLEDRESHYELIECTLCLLHPRPSVQSWI